MKNIMLFTALLPFLVSCVDINGSYGDKEPENQSYIINAKISGVEDQLVKLTSFNMETRESITLDSAMLSNGKFSMEGQVESPQRVFLQLGDQQGIAFYLENSEISIDADVTGTERGMIDADIKGSKTHALRDKYDSIIDSLRNTPEHSELAAINKEYEQAAKSGDKQKQDELYKKRGELSEGLQKDILVMTKSFVKDNMNSVISPELLIYGFNEDNYSLQEMDEIIENLGMEAKTSSYYNMLVDEYEGIKRIQPGQKAPDFTLKDTEGNDVSLSSLKGKYVLIDFWASWCKPCRESYPHLKEVYNQYKDQGFEILAVSNDSNQDAWKKAIKDDGTQWVQVVDTFSKPRHPADVATLYAIPYLPTTILVDKEGVIIAKNLHEEELDAKLAELFGA